MTQSRTIQAAIARLGAGNSAILAANQRLSRYLIDGFFTGGMPIREVKIHPLESWINECWHEAQDLAAPDADLALLNSEQEKLIWQQIVDSLLPQHQLINPATITDALADARSIIDGWEIPLKEINQYPLPETQLLEQCLSEFRDRLAKRRLITREQVLHRLIRYFESGLLNRLEIIYLYGFTDQPPLLRTLLKNAAGRIEALPLTIDEEAPSLNVTCAPNFKMELAAAASWCKTKLEQNPACRIGVIVPGLESVRTQVEQTFIEHFDPEYFSNPAKTSAEVPYDISIGVPLTDIPVISSVFDLFGLLKNELMHQQVLNIAQSPFWGSGIDLTRTEFIAELNRSPERKYRLAVLRERYRNIEDCLEPVNMQASDRLIECARLARRQTGNLPLSSWTTALKIFLKTLGWPGPRPLNSIEYQAVSQFFEWLDLLYSYDNVLSEAFSFSGAVAQIRSMLKRKIFHAQTPHVPIEIMGLMEGAGMTFDFCWLIGMSGDKLPAAPKPNAFIPVQLQKKYSTPRCSVERELEYAQSLIANYKACAREIIFSYSNNSDNESVHVSPLLNDIATHNIDTDTGPDSRSEVIDYLIRCTSINNYLFYRDDSAPILEENQRGFGGISHIKLHNANPLYAFLYYRLGAEEIQLPVLGIDASTRGVIVHLVLARFWREVKTSETLLHYLDDLETRLRKIIDSIMSTFDLSSLSQSEILQEKLRNVEIVSDWLRWEATRPPFTVTGIEEKRQLALLNRHIAVRIDRIDQLATGETVVIDYKTGATNLAGLQKLPLQDPQLPAYALCTNTHINAVAYAEINRKNNRLNGMGALENVQPGILIPSQIKNDDAPDNWPDLITWWRTDLEQSLEQIQTGHCPCETYNPAEAAYYSFLLPITREQEEAADFE